MGLENPFDDAEMHSDAEEQVSVDGDSDFDVPDNLDEQISAKRQKTESGPQLPASKVQAVDGFELDVGHLLATRTYSVDHSKFNSEEYLKELATEGAQALTNVLFQLPTESIDVGVLAVLPKPRLILPREKPCPKPKPPTRWEKFATRMGIKKHGKRDRLVWDEQSEDWKPRYGSDRANNSEKQWLFEAKPNEDPSVDPWTKMKQDKKDRVAKNKKQQVQNLIAATGQKLPGTIDLASAVKNSKPDTPKNVRAKGSSGAKADHAKVALHLAQQSTASMGKFDKLHKDEPKPKQSRIAKKASLVKKDKHTQSGGNKFEQEKSSNLQLLSKVLQPTKLNVGKAASSYKKQIDETNRKVNEIAKNKDSRKRKRSS